MTITELQAIGKSLRPQQSLRNQVALGTVAAARAKRLELGVLGKGFSIGQAQSKGDTSKV